MKRILALLSAALLLWVQPAAAQSILRDAETEALLNDMAKPLFIAAGLSPANAKVVLINDGSINAFVAGGQIVYVHSGLIDAASSANEVQGVIAHEIGHIVGGHAVFQGDGGYTNISILSLLLGVAAMAAGSGEAGTGILMAGQRAAIGKYLAFSRVQESSADAAGAKFINSAGISGKGMLSFFDKLTAQMHRYGYYTSNPEVDPFAQTHPMSQDRVETLKADLMNAPSWNKPLDPNLEVRFKRVQAKLRGYVSDAKDTLAKYPLSNQSVEAHYARAYAYHKSGYPEQAAAETQALVKAEPKDPYFLELEGQILLESGDPKGAIAPLREATALSNNAPLIASTLGHALLATEDKANLDEAERVLKQSVARDNDNPFAWLNLGTVYDRKGDEARTALATAERAHMMGDVGTALMSSRAAMARLPQGSADWVRAQDINMVSQTAWDEMRKKKGRQ
ncbi:M48 family metalloprotease [Sphingomonas kyeonggiensis]|uniref:Putative Zn-dependent protease n=1 Tax=Sphingomonas kyeonggiensis TaxID=1268553 RepID=A0A7W6JWK6_9SPHN|nr:M48 family metalloprotease [Sphingomonas kyeonggiensis]MBB4100904.1 putative Zn-dependent protease [Sphingomonas kyeonggiensis]